MKSTMQDAPLLISDILRHGQQVHGDSSVITVEAGGHRSATFAEVATRAEKLARPLLTRLGRAAGRPGRDVLLEQPGPPGGLPGHPVHGRRAAHPQHPAPGRPAGLRDQPRRGPLHHRRRLADPAAGRRRDELKTVETIIVAGEGDTSALGETLSYEGLLAAEEPGFEWPDLDERSAAAMCYTSGTTGNPKGVVYSHRSTWLHTMAEQAASSVGMTETDRILIIVPMFHANAWGTPYAAWMAGTDMIMPQMFLMGEHLAAVFNELHPTLACGVPTIWNGLLATRHADRLLAGARHHGRRRRGAAVAHRGLRGALRRHHHPGLGHDRDQPAGRLRRCRRPAGTRATTTCTTRSRRAASCAGVEVRVVAEDGTVLPNDGRSVGEFEIRGPWITGSYYKDEDPAKFHDGWLRTGDVGTLDAQGYMTISDRTKDVIKSGGEWISSVELENAVMAHPDVFEAAVIAVPDPKWSERPLVAVVPKPGTLAGAGRPGGVPGGPGAALVAARAVDVRHEVPKTSVGQVRQEGHAGGLRRG